MKILGKYVLTFLALFVAEASLACSALEGPISLESAQARQAQILGSAPRIKALHSAQTDKEIREIVTPMRNAVGASAEGIKLPDEVPEYFATMYKYPDLMKRQAEFSTQLFNGALASRDRELAILRVAWLCQAPYEWGEHVRIGKWVGFTSEDIERVIIGSTAAGWSDHDRAILLAVEEMLSDAMISDSTWSALEEELNEQQLLELPLLVGTYQGVAFLQNSVRFRLEKGNEGLLAR